MKQFDFNDSVIAYNDDGKGSVIVLLHGFAEDSTLWKYQVAALTDHYRVIVPDLPGSGTSTTNDQAADTIGFYAECLYGLLQHEGIDACVMLGHSMGGYITLAFAEKYKSLLKGFGFIHSTAFADSEEKKQNRKRGIGIIEAYGAAAFIKTTTPNLFASNFKAMHADQIEALIDNGKTFTTKALQNYYIAMMNRPDRTHVLNNKLPVLFVIGTEDAAAPLTDLLQQVHLPEIAYIHILKNVGHMGMWEDSNKVNKYVRDYLHETI
jgi:pimeloyl-ACP methyl ester carboxylesterase